MKANRKRKPNQRHRFLSYSKAFVLFMFVLFSTSMTFAQQSATVRGTITDAVTGTPLPGVSIVVKGTSKGVSTDFDGNYVIEASPREMLTYSYVGYKTVDILIGSQRIINVRLEEEVSNLDEVVVVGYGTQRKSDLTGAVAVVAVDDAKKTVTYDVAKMLQGQVAGVTVQSSGEPGGFVNMKIRGVSSFNNNNPLFVIDGMIVDSPYDFAPGDIESIQVLKDASSAAIYGVRGANGVVIITTKSGKGGRQAIRYRGLFGFQNVAKKWSLTNREQYQQITNQAYINAGEAILPGNDPSSPYFISNVDTNWQDAAFRTGIVLNHTVSLQGGTAELGYNLNLDYFKNSSYIDVPQDYERLSGTLNVNGVKGKFKYGAKVGITQSDKNSFNEYNAGTSSIIHLLQAIPTMPVYDANRLGGYGGTDNVTQRAISLNIIGFNNLIDNTAQRNRFIGNIWGEYEIIKGLTYKLSANADKLFVNTRYFVPPNDLGWYYITTNDEASLDVASNNLTRTILDNLLTYDFEIGKHRASALLGWIQERNTYYNQWSRGVGYDPSDIAHIEFANSISSGEYKNQVTGISYLSRLNYAYDDRYLITLNFRQDKSSLFDKDNNTGNYFSVSGAWKLSNEKFIHLPEVISSVKLRGGYGQLGNNTIGVYQYVATVNPFVSYPFGNRLGSGTIAIDMKDPNVKWEVTETINGALEIGMFNEKLQFTGEFYKKESTDLLANVPMPYSTGTFPASITTNAARVRNTGFEFAVTYRDFLTDDLRFDVSANLGTLSNKVLKIGNNDTPITGVNSRTEVGRSIGELYIYETEGIFQDWQEIAGHAIQPGAAPGDIKFRDLNGDGVITDADRSFQGITIPKVSYGFNLTIFYKALDFSMFWQGVTGNKVYNGTYNSLMLGQLVNHHTDMLNYWTPTNTDTNVPRPIIGDPNSNARASDRFVEKGNFIRLQNLQIGYTIPQQAKYFDRARVYLSGQNVWTITKYKGFDPDFISDGLFSRGFEYGSFPNPRTFAIGIEVDF